LLVKEHKFCYNLIRLFVFLFIFLENSLSMTLSKYLILMSLASVVCWVALGLVIFYMNPTSSGVVALSFFYVSLFLAVVGTFAVIGFALRSKIMGGELIFHQVAIAFRQAFWFGILAVVSLWLQSRGILTWYNLILLILALVVIEFFFLSTKTGGRINRAKQN